MFFSYIKGTSEEPEPTYEIKINSLITGMCKLDGNLFCLLSFPTQIDSNNNSNY